MLQATGGTSKGSLGLWWSIWQKLLGKPRSGFSIIHVCWRFWANMRCYQWEQWISFLVAISQIQPPKWSWMYWSCLSIRSCRSQWWQQCWLGDRLLQIGGRGCGTVMEILPTKYIWIPYLMNLIQMEEMCCLVMFGWSAVHSRREKRVVSCNVAAPPKLFLQAQKTYVQSKNCMNVKLPHGRTYKANFLGNELYWIT